MVKMSPDDALRELSELLSVGGDTESTQFSARSHQDHVRRNRERETGHERKGGDSPSRSIIRRSTHRRHLARASASRTLRQVCDSLEATDLVCEVDRILDILWRTLPNDATGEILNIARRVAYALNVSSLTAGLAKRIAHALLLHAMSVCFTYVFATARAKRVALKTAQTHRTLGQTSFTLRGCKGHKAGKEQDRVRRPQHPVGPQTDKAMMADTETQSCSIQRIGSEIVARLNSEVNAGVAGNTMLERSGGKRWGEKSRWKEVNTCPVCRLRVR